MTLHIGDASPEKTVSTSSPRGSHLAFRSHARLLMSSAWVEQGHVPDE
jgi:hypothetical protein